jgi:ribosomal-protein-serine acetyltransferase
VSTKPNSIDLNTINVRLLNQSDAGQFFAVVEENRSYLRRWIPWLDLVLTYEDAVSFVKDTQRGLENQTELSLGIWLHKSNQARQEVAVLIGVVNIHTWNRFNCSANIGYWLAQQYQGHGIMQHSCQTLCNYCFDELEINRLELRCAENNQQSQALAKKLGFVFEGIGRQSEYLYDHFVDHRVYSLLKSQTKPDGS